MKHPHLKGAWSLIAVLIVFSMVLSACAAPTPQVIEKVVTQVVEKEKVIEKPVEKIVEKPVEKVVEKVVTPRIFFRRSCPEARSWARQRVPRLQRSA